VVAHKAFRFLLGDLVRVRVLVFVRVRVGVAVALRVRVADLEAITDGSGVTVGATVPLPERLPVGAAVCDSVAEALTDAVHDALVLPDKEDVGEALKLSEPVPVLEAVRMTV